MLARFIWNILSLRQIILNEERGMLFRNAFLQTYNDESSRTRGVGLLTQAGRFLDLDFSNEIHRFEILARCRRSPIIATAHNDI